MVHVLIYSIPWYAKSYQILYTAVRKVTYYPKPHAPNKQFMSYQILYTMVYKVISDFEYHSTHPTSDSSLRKTLKVILKVMKPVGPSADAKLISSCQVHSYKSLLSPCEEVLKQLFLPAILTAFTFVPN